MCNLAEPAFNLKRCACTSSITACTAYSSYCCKSVFMYMHYLSQQLRLLHTLLLARLGATASWLGCAQGRDEKRNHMDEDGCACLRVCMHVPSVVRHSVYV